ncbi:exported hypothetical protein [Syntrophobacter sp. SbD1]|nr:exported hypothetical protein [Syntrophobacter sp. SbD1]
MNSKEKLIFIILAVPFLLASAYIADAGLAGAMAPAGDNLIVKVLPVVSWSNPGISLSSSGLALPYNSYSARDLDVGPYQYGNINQPCKVPTYNYSGETYYLPCR